jgi:hypothetical protein
MPDPTITTGGKGTYPSPPHKNAPPHKPKPLLLPKTNLPHPPPPTDRLPQATTLLSLAFATDPVITYLLHSMSATARAAYLPSYFSALLKAASLNGARFDEAGEWGSCGVLVPPGKRVDNFWTLVPAGFVGMLGRIGVGGCWVSFNCNVFLLSISFFFIFIFIFFWDSGLFFFRFWCWARYQSTKRGFIGADGAV